MFDQIQNLKSSNMFNRSRPSLLRARQTNSSTEKESSHHLENAIGPHNSNETLVGFQQTVENGIRQSDTACTCKYGERRIRIRYGTMFAHTIMGFASLGLAIWRRDTIALGMTAAMIIAWIIYIPAATALCLAKKATRFDHVAEEIAYLSVQVAGYLGAGLYAALELQLADCNAEWDVFSGGAIINRVDNNHRWCNSLRQSIGINFSHAGSLCIWIIWIWVVVIRISREKGGPKVMRCLQVSTGWLLSGWPVSKGERAPPL